MGLAEYHRKRDFGKTDEPRGSEHPDGASRSFVVQKHAASHLHYDFRLELDGVLKSWAVPKGPSLDPAVKRLAVHVEDHPLEYGSFEGIIPKGEYGGGTVMVWDQGVWEPLDDPQKGYKKGHLKFALHGGKLRGGWHLVRSRRGEDDEKEQWLLFKENDAEARPESDVVITEEMPDSVATGRSIDQIAAEADATWSSNRPPRDGKKAAPAKPRKSPAPPASPSPAPDLAGARKAAMPKEIIPELATLVDAVPTGDGWLHEIKFDGYRMLAFIDDGQLRMLTRKTNDWTDRFSGLSEPLRALPARQAVIDGEVVIVAPNGTTSFQLLQNVMNNGRQSELVYFAFDLLYLDGHDLRGMPLLERKEALRLLLSTADPEGQLRFSDHVVGSGEVFYGHACRVGLEGIIAKRCDSRYVGRRTRDWVKIKCQCRQEFVIGGWTDPKGSRKGFGALLIGYYRDGELIHAGRVGTGFDEATLTDLHRRLKKLAADRSPFANHGQTRAPRDVHWVKPELVGEVSFTEFTEEGVARHPAFLGLREDKPAREVVREEEEPLSAADPSPAPSTDVSAATRGEHDRPSRSRGPLEQPPSTRSRSSARKTPSVEVAGVRLTNPGKVLYPEVGLTKLELARFYEAIADEWMLPYCGGRPLSLVRCPDGAAKPCFYQKHADENFPGAVGRVRVEDKEGEKDVYTYVDSAAGLVSMVQMAVLELHVWGARRDNPDRPDLFVIDLDPAPDVPWDRVIASTLFVREQLGALGLESWCKTTGGKGLHVVVPIARRSTWDEVKGFTHAFVRDLSARVPGQFLTTATLSKRKGKIFLDYLRNGRGATAISAYSVRARPGATISVPLAWNEVTPKLDPARYDPAAVLQRLKKLKRDPWEDFYMAKQAITKGMKQTLGME